MVDGLALFPDSWVWLIFIGIGLLMILLELIVGVGTGLAWCLSGQHSSLVDW